MLSAEEISAMQADQALTFTQSCTIQRRSRTPDGAGGQSGSYADLAESPCRLASTGWQNSDEIKGGRLHGAATLTLALPLGTDIHPRDRVLLAGQTYAVMGIRRRSGASCLRAYLKEAL